MDTIERKMTLENYEATLPLERVAAIDREHQKLLQRVRDLQAIRDLVGQSQTELAAKMGTNQGALSRLERKTEFALRILRRFVHQLGGELDIVVRLPGRPPIRLDRLSDASDGWGRRFRFWENRRFEARRENESIRMGCRGVAVL